MIFSSTNYKDEILIASIYRILNSTNLCSISTVNRKDGSSHINTAFFCYTDKLDLIFISHPESEHCKNIVASPMVGVAIFNTAQNWGSNLLGLQVFGRCSLIAANEQEHTISAYSHRFPEYHASKLEGYQLYKIEPERLKIIDDEIFEEDHIDVTILKR